MSLTVNALRKLQQNGAFPASVPHQIDATSETSDKPTETTIETTIETTGDETETSEAEPDTDTNRVDSTTEDETTEVKPTLELEPPVSPENDQETGDGLPKTIPYDEEDFNIPATDADQTVESWEAASPSTPETPAGKKQTPPAAENIAPDSACSKADIVPSPSEPSTTASSETNTDLEKTEQSSVFRDAKEPFDLHAFDPGSPPHPPSPEQSASPETKSEEDAEAMRFLPLGSDPITETPTSESNVPTDFEPPAPELQHGAHDNSVRDHVSNLNPDPNASDNPPEDEACNHTERDIEPIITESIETLEQILQDAEHSCSETEEPPTPVEITTPWEIAAPPGTAESKTDNDNHENQTDGDKNPTGQDEVANSEDGQDAYRPVIQPFYGLQAEDTKPPEEIPIVGDAPQRLPPPCEPIKEEQLEINPVEKVKPLDDSTPSREEELGSSENLALTSIDISPTITPIGPPEESSFSARSAIESIKPECDYEVELRENLRNPDTEQRFQQLLSQIHALSGDRFPSSVLLLTPQPNGRIADTVTHLGFVMAREGHEVVMLDANLAEQELTRRYEALGKAGVCDVLTETSQVEDIVLPTSNRSIHILPAGDDVTGISRTQNSVEGRTIRNLLQSLTSRGQTVICDADSTRSTLAIPLAEAFDAVLMVVSMKELDQGVVEQATQMLRDRELNLLGYIVTDA